MAAKAYYNDSDPVAAHVLECLIKDRAIADGVVDRRSIAEIDPKVVAGFRQVHLFAGGGLWSIAARMAGWPDDRSLWTGSCPCQGESLAGKRLGADDPRHLWPDFYRLIRAARPSVVVGEQVAAAAGTHWLDRVCADLEDEDYAIRAVDIPACAVDAPHQRQRLFWVALDDGFSTGREGQCGDGDHGERRPRSSGSIASADDLVLTDADGCGRAGRAQDTQRSAQRGAAAERAFGGLLSDAARERRGEGWPEPEVWSGRDASPDADLRNGSCWSDAEWIVSPIDGKARRAKPGIRFLVDGFSRCLDRIRDIEREAWKGVVDVSGNRDPYEVLRILRNAVYAQARREEQSTGVRIELHEAEVLLDFLFCIAATRGGTLKPKLVPEACSEARKRIVRGMWERGAVSGSPCGWRPDEQYSKESPDALLSLSFFLARLVAPYREATRDAYAASNRINLWRIGGNAIVAPLATEVIKALMECMP